MNLDLDTLREMISSTLVELSNPRAGDPKPEEELAVVAQKVADEAEEVADEAAEEEAAEKKAKEEERQENLSSEPPVTAESFQITKGRLRQIIAEELISAKKQGIL